MRELFSVFKNKRVLITGDTGFKGSWLALWLHTLGAKVTGVALPPPLNDDHFSLLNLKKDIQHHDLDLRKGEPFATVFKEAAPELVFHLAAQSLVRYSYQEPQETFEVNVGGSTQVLEQVRKSPSVKVLIFVTSDKCYKNKEWQWGYRENDELGGHDPYSASKAAAEILFATYASSFFQALPALGAASVRAGNVIGGGDWAADRLVPDCVKSLKKEGKIFLRRPAATRPWQHVLESLSGYLTLALKLWNEPKKYSGSWNFGPSIKSVQSVHEVSKKIVAAWGTGEIVIQAEKDAPHEAGLLQLNCDKAAQQLSWFPRWEIERAVQETIDWYAGFYKNEDMREKSLSQIHAYMESGK